MIKDQFGRSFSSLRISLTENCNFSCVYCVTDEHQNVKQNKFGLDTKEYLALIKKIHKVSPLEAIRLTGGEPLLYRDIDALIAGIRDLGINKVTLTCNGYLLPRRVQGLIDAGLTSANISLDAVEEEAFLKATRRRNLARVLEGIEEAHAAHLPIKLNSVIMRGVNDDQVLPLLEYSHRLNIPIRYLELMQMGYLHHDFVKFFYGQKDILETIASKYSFQSIPRTKSATANYWTMDDGHQFGIIANESSPFCQDCNRLRLDSYGKVYGCLSNPNGLSIRNQNASVREVLKEVLAQKQSVKFKGSEMSMMYIGG